MYTAPELLVVRICRSVFLLSTIMNILVDENRPITTDNDDEKLIMYCRQRNEDYTGQSTFGILDYLLLYFVVVHRDAVYELNIRIRTTQKVTLEATIKSNGVSPWSVGHSPRGGNFLCHSKWMRGRMSRRGTWLEEYSPCLNVWMVCDILATHASYSTFNYSGARSMVFFQFRFGFGFPHRPKFNLVNSRTNQQTNTNFVGWGINAARCGNLKVRYSTSMIENK